jgi:DNA modification methylase
MDTNIIHNMDCLEGMKDLPDNSVDLVVTSPPYDNLRDYHGFVFDFEGIAEQLFRVVKSGGVVVWVVGDATINGSETGTSFRQALHFMSLGFNLHDTMIYKKTGCPFPETNRYYPNFEYMFILSKRKPKAVNLICDRKNTYSGSKKNRPNGTGDRQKDGTMKKMSCDALGVNRKIKKIGVRFNVWEIPHIDDARSCHPATFPSKLANDHIKSWSNEGDIVLDPFMGSGTTAIACLKLNRRFIGYEISEEYCKIAEKRIEGWRNQTRLPSFVPPAPGQQE